jgi:hypothetical protein
MSRTQGKFVVLAAVLIAVPLSAFGLTVDGDLSDWGVAAPTTQDYNDWTPSLANTAWTSEDWVIADAYGPDYVGPGYGGQVADAEAMFMHLEGNTLYAAIATGCGPWIVDGYILPGDVFFDFGQNGSYDAAVSTMGSTAGDVWTGTGAWYINPLILYTDQGPYAVDQAVATDRGAGVGFAYSPAAYGPEHYIIEMGFALTAPELAAIEAGGVSAHWTYVCGNDVLDLAYDPSVVPEPTTMVLLGIGVLGFLTRRKLVA